MKRNLSSRSDLIKLIVPWFITKSLLFLVLLDWLELISLAEMRYAMFGW